jgi:hypothetical protein
MKTKLIVLSLLIASTIFVWNGCTGPEGPAGYDGKDGADANVISSPWYKPDTWHSAPDAWYFDVQSSYITQDIVENGIILAYVSLPDDVYANAVRPLPANALGCNWSFLIPDYGSIEFMCDAIEQPGIDHYLFRFILVPASTLLKSSKLKSTQVTDLKNMPYKDVCKIFGIKE